MDVAPQSIRDIGNYHGPYKVSPRRFSKEPYGLVSRQDDPQWNAFLYWVVSATIYAEEQGITKATEYRMPIVNLFGRQHATFLRNVVKAVGSYEEIYERNVANVIRRSGLNMPNTGGPLFLVPD